MIDFIIVFLIAIHWGFALGMHLAVNTQIKTYQLLLLCIVIKYFFVMYGYK